MQKANKEPIPESKQNRVRDVFLSLLMISFPVIVLFFWEINSLYRGDWLQFTKNISPHMLTTYWGMAFHLEIWRDLLIFLGFEILLLQLFPAEKKGRWGSNGLWAFTITMGTYAILVYGFQSFSPTHIYSKLGYYIATLSLFSIFFCIWLYLKGRYFPEEKNLSRSGSFIFDFYWGQELAPKFFGINYKVLTNCRFGMMSWSLILLSMAHAQKELYGLSEGMIVSVLLQFVYCMKFFLWERGYLKTMDMAVDRAGYYICWGCLVWVPAIYTSATAYMVHHPQPLKPLIVLLILGIGLLAIWMNYQTDLQKQIVREQAGRVKIWGKKPTLIYAQSLKTGKNSILLASGYWGISRHFHYLPELFAALMWTVPAGFHALPYFYFFFLLILLLHRAYRAEESCRKKYGLDWERYCKQVPYMLIPYVY